MKIFLMFSLLCLVSCSGGSGNGSDSKKTKEPLVYKDAKYVRVISDDSVPYDSRMYQIIEIVDDKLLYSLGALSFYSQDQDGKPRPGLHPDPDFRVNSAIYSITKIGEGSKIDFMMSTCKDISKDPFEGLVPQVTPKLEQSEDRIIMVVGEDTVVFEKIDEQTFKQLMENKKDVVCAGEEEL